MADRLKKNNQLNLLNRPSLDQTVILKSTNNSRVEEMLPNVARQNANKTMQMRATLYNNPYLGQLQSKIGESKERQQKASILSNMIDSKNIEGVNTSMGATSYN